MTRELADKRRPNCAVVMPVYNEEGVIAEVIDKWTAMLSRVVERFEIHAYNDGSRDQTLSILYRLQQTNPHLVVYDKPNSGHGPTVIEGYREASEAEWIFQMDSDDELGPKPFEALWKQRESYDFLIGRRTGRDQLLARRIMTHFSRLLIEMLYGKGVYDVNCPYRLMRTQPFKACFFSLPEHTFAPNLIVTGYAVMKGMACFEVDVPFRGRRTGEVSIKKWRLMKAAVTALLQTILNRFRFRP
jgi:glycosyltransferase involved in cell wall biosynthesis